MQELRQGTQVKVRIGPAMAIADGVTPVTTLDVSTADQAELLKHNGVATVDISAATFAAITGVDGWYDLTLTTSHTDTLGQCDIVIQDASLNLPLFKSFMVLTQFEWDRKYGAGVAQGDGGGTNTLEVAAAETWGDDQIIGDIIVVNTDGEVQAGIVAGYVASTNIVTFQNDWAVAIAGTSITYQRVPMHLNIISASNPIPASLTGTQTFDMTGNITGNLSGAVGSVTGAVGSVTGNVGGIAGTINDLDGIATLIGALNNISVADVLTTQMTESYSADGAAPTLTQAVMLIQQYLTEKAISGTTLTINKLDGTTPAATLTLDSGSAPTSATRAT